MMLNDLEKINVNTNTSQIEQWSILCSVINYVQYNRNLIDYHELDIRVLGPKRPKIYDSLKDDKQVIDFDFCDTFGQWCK